MYRFGDCCRIFAHQLREFFETCAFEVWVHFRAQEAAHCRIPCIYVTWSRTRSKFTLACPIATSCTSVGVGVYDWHDVIIVRRRYHRSVEKDGWPFDPSGAALKSRICSARIRILVAPERGTPLMPKDVRVGQLHCSRMVEKCIDAYEGVERSSFIGAVSALLSRATVAIPVDSVFADAPPGLRQLLEVNSEDQAKMGAAHEKHCATAATRRCENDSW